MPLPKQPPEKVKNVKTIEILRAIRMNEPIAGPTLAEMFQKSRQAMYMRLKSLEARGFIERVISEPGGYTVPVMYRCSQRLREAERRISGKEADLSPPK
jgi:DNA-binding MarR family transcriptional regulator